MRAPGPGHRRRDEERLTQIAAANAETETLPGPTSGTSNTGTRGDDSSHLHTQPSHSLYLTLNDNAKVLQEITTGD